MFWATVPPCFPGHRVREARWGEEAPKIFSLLTSHPSTLTPPLPVLFSLQCCLQRQEKGKAQNEKTKCPEVTTDRPKRGKSMEAQTRAPDELWNKIT